MGILESINASKKRIVDSFKVSSQGQFEPLIRKLGLDEKTLLGQSLEELHRSLDTVNKSLASYEVYNPVEFTSPYGSSAIKTSITVKMTIVPYLLKSKRLILARIRSLKSPNTGNSNGNSRTGVDF
jgi:hypothetical protein